jgi:hypothetical protein
MRLSKRNLIFSGVAAIGLVAATMGSPAHAGTVTYVTPSGATSGGQAVDAEAVFTTGTHSLTITLTNLEANPTSVVQNLSDLNFTLSNGTNAGFSLSSSSGQEVTVDGSRTPSLGSTVSTGWELSTSGTTQGTLDVLAAGGAGPAHLIIGPPGTGGTYSNANGSIEGNGPHNPFLNQTATFTITGTGITADTTISAMSFSFGTTAGNDVTGQVSVPEPSSLVLGLLGLGLVGAIGYRRKGRRA